MPRILITILVLALSYYPVLYALTWWAKGEVVTSLITAAKARDFDTLERYVSWAKLEKFLRRDLINKAETMRDARSMPSFGPSPDKMASLVDHYITPKGIKMAFAIKKQRYPETNPRAFIAETGIEGPSSFSVTLALPETVKGKAGPALSKGQRRLANKFMRVRFVFERRGWKWRATQMHVPVFLVPKQTYTLAHIKQKLGKDGP